MRIPPFLLRFVSLSFFIIEPGYADNRLLPSTRDSIQFEQQQRLTAELHQRDQLESLTLSPPDEPSLIAEQPAACLPIDTIHLMGATQLSPEMQSQLTLPSTSHCLTFADMQGVAKRITNHYMAQGYITSQATLPEQDLSGRTLTVQVIEGRIGSLHMTDSPSRLARMVFPTQAGDILNLRDIEQGLEQLKRLSSAQYTIDIQPDTQPGYSQVIIHKQGSALPLTGQLNWDNSGSTATGKQLVSTSLSVDSLLGLGEQWSLTASTDTDFSPSHHNRYAVAAINVPYGYWSYRYQFYQNRTLQPFWVANTAYPYQGKNTHQQLDISRLMYRDSTQRLTFQATLKHKHAQTQLAGQTLTISSPALTSLAFSPQYTTTLGHGYLTLNSTAEWGLPAFGATSDTLSARAPRSHYRKFSLSSSYQSRFSNGVTYLTSVYSQYSPDNLYGLERISIGGQYSVRGYHEQSLSGNRGGYWRNEISKEIADTALGNLRVVTALDYGLIAADKYHVETNALAGGAVGLSFTGNHPFYAQLFLSKPLFYPASLNPDPWTAYWSVSLSL